MLGLLINNSKQAGPPRQHKKGEKVRSLIGLRRIFVADAPHVKVQDCVLDPVPSESQARPSALASAHGPPAPFPETKAVGGG